MKEKLEKKKREKVMAESSVPPNRKKQESKSRVTVHKQIVNREGGNVAQVGNSLGTTIDMDEVLSQKQYLVSLEQLMLIPGVKTQIFRKTKRKFKKSQETKVIDIYHVEPSSKVRRLPSSRETGTGAPRVEAIVEGEMIVDAILDAGSHCSIISKRLVDELNLELINPGVISGSRMANGSYAKGLGEVEDLVIAIQGVVVQIRVAVFEDPPYDVLLGSDCLKLLGITADYSTSYFTIRTDEGLSPLKVSFLGTKLRMERIKLDDDWDSGEDYSSKDDDSSCDETESVYESYLIIPCQDPVETFMIEETNTLRTERVTETYENAPSSNKDKIKVIQESVNGCNSLNASEKDQLLQMLFEFLDVFGIDYNDLKQTNLVKLHIDTGNHPPILKKPNRHMSHSELDDFKKEISKMLENGQLIPTMHIPRKDGTSSLGWAFPAMYVGKKNTPERRLVIQFQDLNAITKRDPWPLPSITHLMESYHNARYFSTMDLLKGFNQILVDEDSIPKLTMATPWGCYSYRVMPFGIVNGPSCFSLAIYLAMHDFIDSFVTTYIDDITVYSKSFEEHLSHIRRVLTRIREVNMVIKPSKCMFAREEVEVLGFIVSKDGIKPNPDNVRKIQDFPRPVNKTDIRAFVSLAGFYRRHINCFSDIVAPLNELLKKRAEFVWEEKHEKAYKSIKDCITEATQLKYPDPEAKYKLQ